MNDATQVGISANAQPFTREMERAAQAAMTAGQRIQSAFREAGANIASSMIGALDRVNASAKSSIAVIEHYKGAFAAIGVVATAVTGTAIALKGMVDQSKDSTVEAEKLGRALGIDTTQAGILAVALNDIYTDSDTFLNATKRLTMTLGENESAFTKLGIATRDTNGELLPTLDIMLATNKRLLEFREGTDRNIEGQRLYGKAWGEMQPILKLTTEVMEESKQKSRELGLIIGQENVEAVTRYRAAMNDAGDVIGAMKKAIGDALMPVLTKLGQWFSDVGPAAVTVIKGFIGGLIAIFWGLKNAVVMAFEIINAAVVQIAEPLRALGSALWKIMKGDFEGAKAEFQNIPKVWNKAWDKAFSNIAASAEETREKIFNLYADPTATVKKSGAGKGATDKHKKDKTKAPSGMSDEAWANIEQAHLQKTLLEIATLRAQAEEAMMEKAVQNAEARSRLELVVADGVHAATQDRISELEKTAQYELDLGQISQQQYLARLENFNQMRLDAELALIDAKRAAMMQAEDMDLAAMERLELERQAAQRRYTAESINLQRQSAQQSLSIWKSLGDRIESLWDKGVQAMMNGTLTWRNAWRAIGTEMIGWFGKEVVAKQVKTWIFGEQGKTAATQAGTLARWAMEAGAAAKSVALWAATAVKNIMTSAWEAMAGAWKAIVGIPYVGPFLAPAVAAAAFVGVAGLASNVMSASGGYDIPAGVNPMTQLHEREMVLPAKYADPMRDMLSSGAPAAGGPPITLVARHDSDVVKVGDLKKLLTAMGRNFVVTRS